MAFKLSYFYLLFLALHSKKVIMQALLVLKCEKTKLTSRSASRSAKSFQFYLQNCGLRSLELRNYGCRLPNSKLRLRTCGRAVTNISDLR